MPKQAQPITRATTIRILLQKANQFRNNLEIEVFNQKGKCQNQQSNQSQYQTQQIFKRRNKSNLKLSIKAQLIHLKFMLLLSNLAIFRLL